MFWWFFEQLSKEFGFPQKNSEWNSKFWITVRSTAIVIVAKGHHEIPKDFLLPPFITAVAIAVKEMTPLRPRAIEVSAPIWTREQNQLLRSSTDGALLQVIFILRKRYLLIQVFFRRYREMALLYRLFIFRRYILPKFNYVKFICLLREVMLNRTGIFFNLCILLRMYEP